MKAWSVSETKCKDLMDWLDDIKTHPGLSRSAFITMVLYEKMNETKVKTKQEIKEVKPNNSYANKFINTVKK